MEVYPKYREGATQHEKFAAIMYDKNSAWTVKMQTDYRNDFSPRIAEIITQLGREGEVNLQLQNYVGWVTSIEEVKLVRDALWKQAGEATTL